VICQRRSALRPPVQTPVQTPARTPARTPGRPGWRLDIPGELGVLTFLAALTRLTAINHPHAIVFDEVYFREYALRYLDGTYFFDLHPPLGKLLLAGWAKLLGVSATATSTDPVVVRLLPALAGTALVAVFYLLVRELSGSRPVATFAAALLLLDNAILVQSRLILLDSMLLLFGAGALTCSLAARRATGRARWSLLTASAVLAGMAVATKWTGLGALALVLITWLVHTLRERVGWRRALPQLGVLTLVPAVIYVGVFAVHVRLLVRSGPGDAFMSPRFQSTLLGNPHYDPALQLPFLSKFVELNTAIHGYELALGGSHHPYSSSWISWPVLLRPVYYWTGGPHEYLYLQGNPVIWWGLLVGALVVALGWLHHPQRLRPHREALALLGTGWALNWLPFATITRPMFLYHYLFAWLCCLAAVSVGFGALAGWTGNGEQRWRLPSPRSAVLYWGILAVAAAGFAFFAPLSYGLPLDDSGLTQRLWLHSWR
jgi:dolichyl-phosphate-mannose-protein mannosyltransferase